MSARTNSTDRRRRRINRRDLLDRLILEVLRLATKCKYNAEDEDPKPLVKIRIIAETEQGWRDVMMALVRVIPFHNELGLSAIAMVFEFCPLPARDTIIGFTQSLNLTEERCADAYTSSESIGRERNLMHVVSCIMAKFAANTRGYIVTDELLDYLIRFLMDERCPVLMVAALVALETLCCSSENKAIVDAALRRRMLHPLLPLELYQRDGSAIPTFPWRCVGFAARWALDNTFVHEGRRFSFETVNTSNLNVMLNPRDMSSYLKISSDGLEARCDAHSFESVRATFEITSGSWYYEVEIFSSGVIQIGWATKSTHFESHEGYGVGDDEFSIAYDGCRRLVWHNARSTRVYRPSWLPGDIVGCLADTFRGEVVFSVNGIALPIYRPAFVSSGQGFYPAASFMTDQQCVFNFGARPFAFPPTNRPYQNMNSAANLARSPKPVLPRRLEVEVCTADESPEARHSRCFICRDGEGGFNLGPCRHGAFCPRCVLLLKQCPVCHRPVDSILKRPA